MPDPRPAALATEEDVCVFLAAALGVGRERLSVWTRLRQDLHVDGDAAQALLADFSYIFQVDLTGFRVSDYFAAGAGPGMPFFPALLLALFGNGRALKTLTVRDLVRAADTGRFSKTAPFAAKYFK